MPALNWRYAAKNMNGAKIPQEKLDAILEAIRLSPSSAGLQPYQIAVISEPATKGKIHELACPQPQVVECSHLLVFASRISVDDADVDSSMNLIAATRDVPVSSLAAFGDSIKGGMRTLTPEQQTDWATRQAYIALGIGLVAAAMDGVDATPMEGFDGPALDALLGLKEKGLRSVVLLALGFRDDEKDFLASAKKVRKPNETLFM